MGTCGDTLVGAAGVCVAVPEDCSGEPDAVVCGCDGWTYPNDCARKMAQVPRAGFLPRP